MGYGSSSKVTHRIELRDFDGSDNWVDIKARRSIDDKEAISMAGIKVGTGSAVIRMQGVELPADVSGFNFGLARVVRFQRSIIAWSLKFDDGDSEPITLTEEGFRKLDADVAEWLSDAIEAYYQSRRPSTDAFLTSNGASTAR